MEIKIREFEPKDIEQMCGIWNTVVEEANAFPQNNKLDAASAVKFFGEQTFTGADVAVATTADETVAYGPLNGVYQSTDITEGYVLQNHNGNVGFYHVASTSTVKPFRAYLTSGNADARISIVYADETTGINMIEDGRMDIGNGIYDLQGRRIESSTFNTQSSNLKKGIYVKNGKKHIVK